MPVVTDITAMLLHCGPPSATPPLQALPTLGSNVLKAYTGLPVDTTPVKLIKSDKTNKQNWTVMLLHWGSSPSATPPLQALPTLGSNVLKDLHREDSCPILMSLQCCCTVDHRHASATPPLQALPKVLSNK